MVTKLDRLARSVPDALGILRELSDREVKSALGGSVYDWNDAFARMFLTILATIAEFEAALIRQRAREGMQTHATGERNIVELAEIFKRIGRPCPSGPRWPPCPGRRWRVRHLAWGAALLE